MMFVKHKKLWRQHCKSTTSGLVQTNRQIETSVLATQQSTTTTIIKVSEEEEIKLLQFTRERYNETTKIKIANSNIKKRIQIERQIAKQDILKPLHSLEQNCLHQIRNNITTIGKSPPSSQLMSSLCGKRMKRTMRRAASNQSPTGNGDFCKMNQKQKQLQWSRQLIRSKETLLPTKHGYCCQIIASLLLTLLALASQQTSLVGSMDSTGLIRGNIAGSGFVRLCVTLGDYAECLQMSDVANGTISCVKARDKYECMKHIIDDKADIVNLNNEELYLAGRMYNLEPFALEQYKGDIQHYKSVVIINNKANINSIADLRGKRSCHGGLNSTHGWDIPIGLLLATMTMSPDCRGELYSVSKFFDQSCAPGAWSSDPSVDAELKKIHPSLCAACQNSTLCSVMDEFAGDDGALRCLFSGYGQVAFTTSKTVERFLTADRLDRRLMSNYVYLCLDGTKLPLGGKPCEWAHKPTNVFVTSPDKKREKDWYLGYLQQLFFRFVPYKPSWWRMKSLFSDPLHVTQILPVPSNLQRWDKYLGNYISSIEKPLPLCDLNSVVVCTTSSQEELKCLDLQKAAFSQRIRPEIDCKRRASKQECLELVAKRQADLVVVDISDLYEASQAIVQQLEPVGVAQGFTDYSVAVVRADSGLKFLYQLGGRRSCHASFGDTASWLAPLSVLTERSLLDQQSCNKADQVAEYFGGSCVPGAADLRVNHYRSGSEKLCAVCRGDSLSQHQCERSTSEKYYGQAGTLRCLVEGAGEVAFMSLSSLAAHVDGRSPEMWARSVPLALDSRNFKLVCRSGPSMPLGDYERCHLTKLPGKVMVSAKFTTKEDRLAIRHLLTRLVDKFAGENREMFELFGPYLNESDLLFDDSTTGIVSMKLDSSTFDMVSRLHFDPSFQQIPITNKDANCKVVLTTSAAVAQTPTNISSSLIFILLNCISLMAIVSHNYQSSIRVPLLGSIM